MSSFDPCVPLLLNHTVIGPLHRLGELSRAGNFSVLLVFWPHSAGPSAYEKERILRAAAEEGFLVQNVDSVFTPEDVDNRTYQYKDNHFTEQGQLCMAKAIQGFLEGGEPPPIGTCAEILSER